MSVSVQLEELLGYTDYERAKWRTWVEANPSRMRLPFQSGGRFPTVGTLLDHIFLAERRNLARLEGGTPPELTGVATGDWKALFEYADLVRADLRQYAADVTDDRGSEVLSFGVEGGDMVTMTRRKLAVHVVMHEVRHLAQLAYAVRLAGHEPPGAHDLFYFPEFA